MKEEFTVYAAARGSAVIQLYSKEADAQWRVDRLNRHQFHSGKKARVIPLQVRTSTGVRTAIEQVIMPLTGEEAVPITNSWEQWRRRNAGRRD